MKATKKALLELNRIFDFLGKFDGQVETNDPEEWATLEVEVNDLQHISIGMFELVDGDVVLNPSFELKVKRLKGTGAFIEDAEITSYEAYEPFGLVTIDENGVYNAENSLTGNGEKDEFGLSARFSYFMNQIVEEGPYLKEPKNVKKYEKMAAVE